MAVESGTKVLGLGATLRHLTETGARANDVRPIKEAVRAVYLKSEQRLWSEALFIPNTEATIERKQRQGLDMRVERATGALEKSLTSKRAKGAINRAKRDQLRFGSSLFYAGFQEGTVHQLPRDLIALSASDRQQIDDILSSYIAHGTGAIAP